MGPIKGPAGSGGAHLGFGQAGWGLDEVRFGFEVVEWLDLGVVLG